MRCFRGCFAPVVALFATPALAQPTELPVAELTRMGVDWAEICPAPEGYGTPCIGLTTYRNPTCNDRDYCGAGMLPLATVLDYVDTVPADRPLAYSLRRFDENASDYNGVFCLIDRRPAMTYRKCAWVSETRG